MPRMRPLLALAALALAACNGLPLEDTTTTTSGSGETTTTTTTVPEVTETAAGCEGDPTDYRVDGPLGIVGEAGADARQIAAITLTAIGDCERFEVALRTEGGAPATSLPSAEVELIAASGIVRIKFDPLVGVSAITDSILEGDLVDRAYVVRSLDGSIFVDAHLRGAVAARTFTRQNPARVAVELQPIDAAGPLFPLRGGLVVVTGPTVGSLEYPIEITGYARTFEGTVLARVLTETGTETEVFTTAADSVQLWGEFSLVIEDGPGGDITIFVGEESPVDGSESGVEVEVSAG